MINRLVFVAAAWIGAAGLAWAEMPRGTLCEFPDLTGIPPVIMQPGAAPAVGTGGDVPGGRWELVALRYESDFPITGEAIGALELNAASANSGSGSLALDVTVTSPTAYQSEETGAGPYLASGSVLDFTNDCGESLTLGEAEYSVDTSEPDPVMTLWGSIEFQVTDPFPILVTVDLEAEFLLTEVQTADDPVFEDRFEVE